MTLADQHAPQDEEGDSGAFEGEEEEEGDEDEGEEPAQVSRTQASVYPRAVPERVALQGRQGSLTALLLGDEVRRSSSLHQFEPNPRSRAQLLAVTRKMRTKMRNTRRTVKLITTSQ